MTIEELQDRLQKLKIAQIMTQEKVIISRLADRIEFSKISAERNKKYIETNLKNYEAIYRKMRPYRDYVIFITDDIPYQEIEKELKEITIRVSAELGISSQGYSSLFLENPKKKVQNYLDTTVISEEASILEDKLYVIHQEIKKAEEQLSQEITSGLKEQQKQTDFYERIEEPKLSFSEKPGETLKKQEPKQKTVQFSDITHTSDKISRFEVQEISQGRVVALSIPRFEVNESFQSRIAVICLSIPKFEVNEVIKEQVSASNNLKIETANQEKAKAIQKLENIKKDINKQIKDAIVKKEKKNIETVQEEIKELVKKTQEDTSNETKKQFTKSLKELLDKLKFPFGLNQPTQNINDGSHGEEQSLEGELQPKSSSISISMDEDCDEDLLACAGDEVRSYIDEGQSAASSSQGVNLVQKEFITEADKSRKQQSEEQKRREQWQEESSACA